MKARFTLIAALFCLFSMNVFANRNYYVRLDLSDDLTKDGWMLAGGTGEGEAGTGTIITATSSTVTLTKNYSDVIDAAKAYRCLLKGVQVGSDNATVKVVLVGEDGIEATYTNTSKLPNDAEKTFDITLLNQGSITPEKVKTIKIIVDGLVEDASLVINHLEIQSDWIYPTVNGVLGSTTRVEAEDIDEGADPSFGLGTTYYTTMSGTDMYQPWLNRKVTIQSNADDYNHYSNHWALMNMGADDWTGNKWTKEDAWTVENCVRYFGNWYNYTVKVEQDCDVDITMGVGCHWGSYQTIAQIGVQENNAACTATLGYHWVKHYIGAYTLRLDGQNLKGTQTKHPNILDCEGGINEETWKALIADDSKWRSSQVLKDGMTTNNDTVWVWPNLNNAAGSISSWWPMQTDQPQYTTVHLTKGEHVFTMQSYAPQFSFDYFDIKVVNNGPTSIAALISPEHQVIRMGPDKAEWKDNASYQIYELTGRRVAQGIGTEADFSKMANGVYILKVGKAKVKFIKK